MNAYLDFYHQMIKFKQIILLVRIHFLEFSIFKLNIELDLMKKLF